MTKKMVIIGPEGAQVVASNPDLLEESESSLREVIATYSRANEKRTMGYRKNDWMDQIVRDAELILMDRKYGKER